MVSEMMLDVNYVTSEVRNLLPYSVVIHLKVYIMTILYTYEKHLGTPYSVRVRHITTATNHVTTTRHTGACVNEIER